MSRAKRVALACRRAGVARHRRGRALGIDVTFETSRPATLFVDLFRVTESGADRVAPAEPGAMSLTSFDGFSLIELAGAGGRRGWVRAQRAGS